MHETLPHFNYHPDPLKTRAIVRSDASCACCGEVRGFIYAASVYSKHELDKKLCPWCIADGSAAAKFEASFTDDDPLLRKGIEKSIVAEVTQRTPGYSSWQQETWLSHCDDACEFHGDASVKEVADATSEAKREWIFEPKLSETNWQNITSRYSPDGDPAIYKFVCRHCRQSFFSWDCS